MNIRFWGFVGIFMTMTSCVNEYRAHFQENIFQNTVATYISGASFTGEIFVLPDKRHLQNLVESIKAAQKTIWIEIYTWTEKDTLDAVIRAKRRGLDVRVILEGNVYQTPRINDPTQKKLENEGIPVVFSNPDFTFTHMKSWIIDDMWCISTGNWSYSTFTKNREFYYCSHDPSMKNSLSTLFLADFSHKRPLFAGSGSIDAHLGIAPEYLRSWLMDHLSDTKKSILVYNQTISDPQILQFLSLKSRQGIHVELCQSINSFSGKENIRTEYFSGITWKTSQKPYLHAKVFLLDGEKILLGSANLTENALDRNREIMVLLPKDQYIYEKIIGKYQEDCRIFQDEVFAK